MRLIVYLLTVLAVGWPDVLAKPVAVCYPPAYVPPVYMLWGGYKIRSTCRILLQELGEDVLNYLQEKGDILTADLVVKKNKGFPSCLSTGICTADVDVIENWKIAGTECWNIEPIYWVTCKKDEPHFPCPPDEEEVGYTCQQQFVYQTVWACCGNSGGASIRQVSVKVPYGCCVKVYNCGKEPAKCIDEDDTETTKAAPLFFSTKGYMGKQGPLRRNEKRKAKEFMKEKKERKKGPKKQREPKKVKERISRQQKKARS